MKPTLWITVLAFFSLLAFGGGTALHFAPAGPAAGAAPAKPAVHTKHSKDKAASKPASTAPVGGSQIGGGALAFPLMLGGGVGLLLSVLAGLSLCHSLLNSQPQAARRWQEAERAAQQKQKAEFEAQQAALQTQLLEAKQRKAETEALRDQVSRQFQEFFRTLPVPCFCFAANGRIIRWNAACEVLYGIPAAAAMESTLWETIVPDAEREEVEAKFSRVLAGESLLAEERRDRTAGRVLSRLRCSMVPLYDAEGTIIGGLSAGVDIAEFTHQEQHIAALLTELETAHQDVEHAKLAAVAAEKQTETAPAPAEAAATDLLGHTAFRARLAEEIARASRYHSAMSLVLFDLDGFAARNEALGFEAGDQALQLAETLVRSKIRTVDIFARLGADEYAIILPETGDAGARVAVERMRVGLSGSSLGSQPPVTACFGVTQLTPEVSGVEMLIARVQAALAGAQSLGTNIVVHYQDLPQSKQLAPAPAAPPRRRTPAKQKVA